METILGIITRKVQFKISWCSACPYVYACVHMTVKFASLIYTCTNFKMCITETSSKERHWVEAFKFLWKAGFIFNAAQYLGSAARNFVFAFKACHQEVQNLSSHLTPKCLDIKIQGIIILPVDVKWIRNLVLQSYGTKCDENWQEDTNVEYLGPGEEYKIF